MMLVYQALCSFLILTWIAPRGNAEKRTYMTYDMTSICKRLRSFKISMHHSGTGSTGILKADDYLEEAEEKECIAVIRPPAGYGVVFNIEDVKLRRDHNFGCRDFIKIYNETSSSNSTAPVCRECCRYSGRTSAQGCRSRCGYEEEGRVCEEYCDQDNNTVHMGIGRSIAVLYHTRCATCTLLREQAGFRIVFTAYKILSGTEACDWPMSFQCDNGRCIWAGLTCDGHNNCGDMSDESKSGNSQCAGFPQPVKYAIVASAVVVTVLLGVVLAYLPRLSLRTFLCQKKKKASLRLSQRRVKFMNPVASSEDKNSGGCQGTSKERLPRICEHPLREIEV